MTDYKGNHLIQSILHADEGLHWSDLKHMATSPQHFLSALHTDFPMTKAMRFGNLIDGIIYHGEIPPVWDGYFRGKGKNSDGVHWDDWSAAHGVKNNEDAYKPDEVEDALMCVDSIRKHPKAMSILVESASQTQTVMRWPLKGLGDTYAEGTPDSVGVYEGRKYVADLKVTPVVEKRRFYRHAWDMGWFGQVAWYSLPTEAVDLYIVAAQPTRPWEVVVYKMSERLVRAADDHWKDLINRIRFCINNDDWPWRTDAIEEIDIPDTDYGVELEGEVF